MARRAARQHLATAQFADLSVYFFLLRRCYVVGVPLYVGDLTARPNIRCRITMASDTPLHLQGVFLIDGRHIVDLTMARRTADALCYVDTVIEINELRQVMHAFPLNGLI